MNRTDLRILLLAACLAALAGLVDAIGFLALRGFFVSFMSGNSTRLAIGLAGGDRRVALVAGALIALFVAGVTAGELANQVMGRRRHRLLGLVALLLALAALAASRGSEPAAIGLATLALGAENAALQRAGPVSIGVTYMTGTLVKLGHGLAAALAGGPRWDWAPYLLLWGALAGGSVLGARLFPTLRLQGLWLAAIWCALLAGLVALGGRRTPELDRVSGS